LRRAAHGCRTLWDNSGEGTVSILREAPPHHKHGSMIDACYNAECKKELRYLREGRIVRIVRSDGNEARLEHFWLCGPCSDAYEFVFDPGGSVNLKHRHGGQSAITPA
jgi:hypothetical protein